MRIYYFNDRPLSVRVFTNDLRGNGLKLEAHTGMWFKVNIPEESELYVKVWDDVVLIGVISFYDTPETKELK